MEWSIANDDLRRQVQLPLVEVDEGPILTPEQEASFKDFMNTLSYVCVGGSAEYQEKLM